MELSQTSEGRAAQRSPKRALVASALSFLAPGVGQAFNGDLKGAASWGVTVPAVILIASAMRVTEIFLGLVSSLATQLLISALSARSTFRYARSHARKDGSRSTLWLKSVGAATLAGFLVVALDYAAISSATIRFYKVTGGSMVPTIGVGDRIAVDLRYYHHHAPQKGDVVYLKLPNGLSPVKRIEALGGDVVEGKEGRAFVNGEPFDDRHRVDVHGLDARWKRMTEFGPETVLPGQFFVVGDNRAHSWDSRSPDFGPVDRTDIKGRALYACWSKDLSRIGQRIE